MRQMQDQIEGGMASHAAVDAVVIFAIDNGSDPRTRARFERHLDTLRAMGMLRRPVRLCVGMWRGKLEASYEMLRSDFEMHVMMGGWIAQQEAVLAVVANQAVLIDQQGNVQPAGYWSRIPARAAADHEGWTCYLDTNEYFVAFWRFCLQPSGWNQKRQINIGETDAPDNYDRQGLPQGLHRGASPPARGCRCL